MLKRSCMGSRNLEVDSFEQLEATNLYHTDCGSCYMMIITSSYNLVLVTNLYSELLGAGGKINGYITLVS